MNEKCNITVAEIPNIREEETEHDNEIYEIDPTENHHLDFRPIENEKHSDNNVVDSDKNGEIKFICEECGERFETENTLNEHIIQKTYL